MVSTLSALRIYHNAMDYRMLGVWLEKRGIESVNALTANLMTEYAEYLRTDRRVARGTAINHLIAITRLWVLGRQVPELRLAGKPPWTLGQLDEYLPAPNLATGENITEPIGAATMSPLIGAAIQMVERGTEPILRGAGLDAAIRKATREKPGNGGRNGGLKLRAYLKNLKDRGAPLPIRVHNARVTVDSTYIGYINEVSVNSVYAWSATAEVRDYAAAHGEPTNVPLVECDVMPSCIPLAEVKRYVGLLRSACFVVIAYLTGMRPGEVLAIESGSLRPAGRDGGWMLLHSRTFKSARDENGNHDSNGKVREAPWVAISPVIKAIRTLERLEGDKGLLFPAAVHAAGRGRSRSHATAADGVLRFIAHVNTLTPGAIPDDEAGRVTPVRFRRTLAWHIANQPGGLVALAIQYGHLRTAVSEGYASRVRDGIHDMIDFETARSVAIGLSQVAEAMDNGAGISGPAAMRFVSALREQSEQFNGIVTSKRQARSLLSNSKLSIFQNEETFVWCNFQRDTALCLDTVGPDKANTPRLDHCKDNCFNVAQTDSQADGLRARADQLRREAAHMPRPSAERLTSTADNLEARAIQHDRDRKTLGEFDAHT